MSIKYEDYLDKHCSRDKWTFNHQDVHDIGLPWMIQLKVWWLKVRRGVFSRVTLEYHYHCTESDRPRASGYGFARIHKYYPDKDLPIGLEIEKGDL